MRDLIEKSVIDKFSFQLGMINCFAEMVACGVKKLAISPPLLPSQYETIAPYSEKIVEGFAIESYLENSLLITLLQSPEFTRGKCSILYYKSGSILETYLELKARQASLVESGRYDVQSREEISIAFMELLTYPPEVIEAKLAGSHPDPFLIIEP
ncbi:MAG: hypothetical protein KJO60_09295 [Desulfofustis sp.]|nr:hypothetical protein [Bacteroidia bacterium]MBT8354706.1 hypothetical protein [Desulfofustis sp.]NNK57500.1 hypothetical protein [Desulfofustis sp.]